MRTLIYCCSVYQVFNAIHISMHVLKGDRIDIMLSDYLPDYRSVAAGLRATGLFESVYEVQSKSIAKQHYKHTRWTVYGYRLFPNLVLSQANAVLKKRYDRYYFATFDDFIGFLYLGMRRRNRNLQCCCFEDGGATYMRTFKSTNSVEERLYRWLKLKPLGKETVPLLVYEPDLMTFECGASVYAMPKISYHDNAFRKCINTVFGIDSPQPPQQSAIFFEESFLADGLKNNDEEIIRFCAQLCGDNMVLKPHPRNPFNRFEDSSIPILHSHVPWEVFCMNCDLEGKVLLTINSNAAISPHIIFENAPQSILLFHLLKGESNLKGKPEYDRYYEKILLRFPEKIKAPKTFVELEEELNHDLRNGQHHNTGV